MNKVDKNNFQKKYEFDMAIVVVSYDGYSDLWDDYFNLLNKYWNDREYPVYLANNTKKIKYKNVFYINCGEHSQWSTRTRIAIENINASYICLLLEDFFTSSKVNNNTIKEIVEFIKNNNIKYYKLNSFSRIRTNNYKDKEYLHIIPENLDYGISLQPAIWERNFLLELLGSEDYNAWKFESNRIKESSIGTNMPLKGCLFDSRNVLEICHGVVQGKYLPPAYKLFKDNNYYLNISERTVMTKKEYYLYKLKSIGKEIIPRKQKRIIKNILRKIGFKFVIE